MGTYENPSADKFRPPPGEERFEAPKPRRTLQWSAVLLAVFVGVGRIALDNLHVRGRAEYVVLAALVGIGVAEFIKSKRDRDRHEDANRPNIHQITPR